MAALHLPTQLPHNPSVLPPLSCHTVGRAQETQVQVHIPRLMPKCNCQHFPSKHKRRSLTSYVSFGLSGYVICLENGSSSKEKPNPVILIYQEEAVRSQTFTLPWCSLVMMPPPVWRGKNQVPRRWQTISSTATRSTSLYAAIWLSNLCCLLPSTSTLGPQELPAGQLNSFKRKSKN